MSEGPGSSTQAPLSSDGSDPATAPTSRPAPGADEPSAALTTTAPAAGSCRAVAEDMTTEEQVGQLMMVGLSSDTDLPDPTAEILRTHHVGSVLLLENTERGVDGVRSLTDAVRGSAPQDAATVLVAVDQEGGQVQRLRGPGFTRIPSAAEQGELDDDDLREQASTWGAELAAAGVDLDLAPVVDVVPQDKVGSNEPVGRLARGYGSDPDAVARKASAFVEGMDAAGVATSVKHFPGLGEVVGNTDHRAGVVDDDTTADSETLTAFSTTIDAGADSVMMATATYTALDPDHRAAFSEAVVTDLLRGDLGFDGVVVSDDLGVAVAVTDLAPADRAVQFVRAGGDLVVTADPALTEAMTTGLRQEAAADPEFAEALPGHVTRVLELKSRRGLAHCG